MLLNTAKKQYKVVREVLNGETNNVYVILILKVKVTANRRHTYEGHGLEDEQTTSKEMWKAEYSG